MPDPSTHLRRQQGQSTRLVPISPQMNQRSSLLILIIWIYWDQSGPAICSAFTPSRNVARLGEKDIVTSHYSTLFDKPDGDDGWDLEPISAKAQTDLNMTPIKTSLSKGERDLFVPVFAFVSLLALFGGYGYETLRLYSQGEFYSPWH